MASFRERKLKDGTTSVTALIEIRIPKSSEKFRDARTFGKKKDAQKWATAREKEIRAQIKAGDTPTKRNAQGRALGDAITTYIEKDRRGMGKTKAQVLATIRDECAISRLPCDKITVAEIYSFAEEIADRPEVNSPGTVDNYLQHLSAVFSIAPAWGFDLDQQAMRLAKKSAKEMALSGPAKERTRRPTKDELDSLMGHFTNQYERDSRVAPMHVIVAFAIFSTRRQAEITRITWADYETSHDSLPARVMVRHLKHPGDKWGNDTWCDLPDPCQAIIAALPRKPQEKRIFPYHPDTISARFTRACQFLEIDDLHFHDLRHEGTSRLFEMDWQITRVANVTGHRSWASLKRYEHIRAKGDIYDGWNWLDRVT